jgi:DNA-binding LytR/AlgR family response regulator
MSDMDYMMSFSKTIYLFHNKSKRKIIVTGEIDFIEEKEKGCEVHMVSGGFLEISDKMDDIKERIFK